MKIFEVSKPLFSSECFKSSSLTTTSLFLLLTLILKASCVLPAVFLAVKLADSITRGDFLSLSVIFLFCTGAIFLLVDLFADVFSRILVSAITHNLILESAGVTQRMDGKEKAIFKDQNPDLNHIVSAGLTSLKLLGGSILMLSFLIPALVYFAPLGVIVVIPGSLVFYWFVRENNPLENHPENQNMDLSLPEISPDIVFEAAYYGITRFLLDELAFVVKKRTLNHCENKKIRDLMGFCGRITALLFILLGAGIVGYQCLTGRATFGSVVSVIIFGPILQKSLVNLLLSLKKIALVNRIYGEARQYFDRWAGPQDMEEFLEEQLEDKFSLTEGFELSLEIRKTTFLLDAKRGVKDLSLSIFTGERVAIVCTKTERDALLEIFLGIHKPIKGEVAYYSVDHGRVSYLRARRQMTYLTLSENGDTTLRELVGFGDIRHLKQDSQLFEAIQRAGISSVYSKQKRWDDKPIVTPPEKLRLLYARSLFGERKFIFIDGFISEESSDKALFEELNKNRENTIVILTPWPPESADLTKTYYLQDYIYNIV